MNRRDVVAGLSALLAAPAFSQERQGARVGWLTTGDTFPRHYFDEALARLGWIEGRNLKVERRVTGPDPARRHEMIAELVALGPDLIVAGGTTDAVPLRAATATVPIVVVTGTDFIQTGLAESLGRPGGNVTGLTVLGRELDEKRLELVRELMPNAGRVSMLGVPSISTYGPRLADAATIARKMGFVLTARMLNQPADLDAAFEVAASDGDQAVLVPYNALTFENRPRLIAAATRLRLPAIYELREYVSSGGLISYGAIYRDYFERAAILADKILRGARPSELPVEQPTALAAFAKLRELIREAGRKPEDVGLEVWVSPGAGNEEDWRREIAFWRDAGVTHVTAHTTYTSEHHRRVSGRSAAEHLAALTRYRAAVADLV